MQPNIFVVEILLWNTQETSLIFQQQSREKRSIQRIHNLVVICTILYTKIEITGKYVYLSKLVLFSKRQLLLKMKCEIGDFAKQMYTFHCAFFFKYMHLNIMFYYVVYQKNQILIETKRCYSIINFNYRC